MASSAHLTAGLRGFEQLLAGGEHSRPTLAEDGIAGAGVRSGAEPSLGGISGHVVVETTDESPKCVALIRELSAACVRLQFISSSPAPTPAPAPNRRRYSEDRLLDAALAVFGERGYRSAQMSEIAQAADTTKQTLYARLGSKEALYLRVLQREVDQLKATLLAAYREAADLPLHDLIGVSMRAFFRYAAEHPAAYAVLFRSDLDGPGYEIRERTRDELMGYVGELAAAKIERTGERAPGPSTHLIAAATIGVSVQICEYAVANGYDLTGAEAVASAYTEAAIRGIDVGALAAVDAATETVPAGRVSRG